MSRHRCYTFTVNNYTPDHESSLQSLKCKYLVYGRECAPDTGTPHLQGYISFGSALTFASVIKKIPGAHVEVALGTGEENRIYCSKGGSFFESGCCPQDPKAQGKVEQGRWVCALASCKSGDFGSVPPDIMFRYYSTCNRLKKDFAVKPSSLSSLCNYWFYGSSGSGKSRSARSQFPSAYTKPLTKWWDSYQNEVEVIIDDMDPFHKCLGYELKIWGDHYPFQAETKGGSLLIRPVSIIITSQYLPTMIWDDQSTVDAIMRRYQIVHYPLIPPLFPIFHTEDSV